MSSLFDDERPQSAELVKTKYRNFIPRPYQLEAVDAVMAEFKKGIPGALVRLGTGLGKTLVSCFVMDRWLQEDQNNRVIVIAHERQLIWQFAQEIEDYFGQSPALEMSSSHVASGDDPLIIVASRQTLIERTVDGENASRLFKFDTKKNYLVVIDECFPAGTLVDGRKIETLKVGDFVNSFNHHKGIVEKKRIVTVFKKKTNEIARIRLTNGQELVCTPNHPIFTDRGYVKARDLCSCDVVYKMEVRSHVKSKIMPNEREVSANIISHMATQSRLLGLFKKQDNGVHIKTSEMQDLQYGVHVECNKEYQNTNDMLQRMQKKGPTASYGEAKQGRYICENECEQSDEKTGNSGKGFKDTQRDWSLSKNTWREWTWADKMRSYFSECSWRWMGMRNACEHWMQRILSNALQTGYCKLGYESCSGSGWRFSQFTVKAGAGCEERLLLNEYRVESIEIQEQGCSGEFDKLCGDGTVYDIEVEGNHNFFADGVLVHNCHRWSYKLKTCRHILEYFEQNPNSRRLALTATPSRSDKVSLRRICPSIAYDYPHFDPCGGPSAVRDGWCVPYEQKFINVNGLDFSKLKELAGDFDPHDLEEILKGELEKFVHPMLELVGKKQTLIFNPTVAFAQNVAQFINGVLRPDDPELIAISINGATPEDVRKDTYRRFENKEFQFLSVCGLCIAKDSLVLTDKGEVPIQDVTLEMKLWDGVEFVSHGGVIYKGRKEVIEYAGLKATEDHKVWTNAGWKPFYQCQDNGIPIAVGGIDGRLIRTFDKYYKGECLRRFHVSVEDVYDILNAGPRNRFTANGLIVSNCREGYNNCNLEALAMFRPSKNKELVIQMLGRGCRTLKGLLNGLDKVEDRLKAIATSSKKNCLVIDLVGVTSLPAYQSTARLMAEGLPDEIIEDVVAKVNKKIADSTPNESCDVGEEVRKARSEVEAEREKLRREREETERRALERARKRAELKARVNYSVHDVSQGNGGSVVSNNSLVRPATPAQLNYLHVHKIPIPEKGIGFKAASRIIGQLASGKSRDEVMATNKLGAKKRESISISIKEFDFSEAFGILREPT